MAERGKVQMAAYAVAALLVVVAGVRYLDARGDDSAAGNPAVALEDGAAAEAGGTSGDEPKQLYVHVAGAVRREGLYRLPVGSRIGAAVERAGGVLPRAELGGVNLAAELQDGQQVVVPKHGEGVPVAGSAGAPAAPSTAAGGSSGAAGAAGAPASPVSLATATPEQLDAAVDGIGPTLAARIIEFRDENGGIKSIEQLRDVDGIGEARFASLKEAVTP